MAPSTIDDIYGLSDHDILIRMYQKLIDHMQAEAEQKNAVQATLADHEERICKLEENEIVETTRSGMLAAITKNPIFLFIVCNIITGLAWFGYKLICHVFGMRI